MGSSLKSKQDPFSLPVLWNQEMAPVSADHLVEGFVKIMKRGFLTGMRQTYRLQCVSGYSGAIKLSSNCSVNSQSSFK